MNQFLRIIHVVGASGSGTTTLGKAIRAYAGHLHLDTDDYYWLPTDPPFTAKREIAERQSLLKADMAKTDKCVITGSLCGWGDIFMLSFDLVVYIETPTDIRINRIKQRELERFGNRILPGGDMHEEHVEFIEWAKTYDNGGLDSRSRALHIAWLKNVTCPILTVDGTSPVEEILARITGAEQKPV